MDAEIVELDAELVRLCQGIHVLSHLSWPAAAGEAYLAERDRGKHVLPAIRYDAPDLSTTLEGLDKLIARTEAAAHPATRFLCRTAQSYHTAGRLVMNAGSNVAGVLSVELYGRPGNALPGTGLTSLDAARALVDASSAYEAKHRTAESDYCLSAQHVAAELERQLTSVFAPDAIRIVIDPDLTAKAAAGATRIRLRDATCFSELDIGQLLQHEAFVHSLTALNGRAQPHLTALSLGAPRTTMTQEGLATFAELITGAVDISRMKRIALRVNAVEAAQNGANFHDVFDLFVEAGQPVSESFNSAQRIFRGVPVTGGTAFTKDCVYLEGMLLVHTFFHWALASNRFELCEHLFFGRMTIDDVLDLEPLVKQGDIAPPSLLPPWMTNVTGLTGYLAFSLFANNIDFGAPELETHFERLAAQ